MDCITEVSGGVEIKVKVVPGASRDRIAGLLGDALKVQISAPPERGRANKAVADLLAKKLDVSAREVSLVRGATSPRKVFHVEGVTIENAGTKLGLSG